MADVFISYASEERAAVTPIADALGLLGLDVWFDQMLQVGGRWDDEIQKELQSALAVIVCWSPVSITSGWVMHEATFAQQKGNLAPVYIGECAAPGPHARIQGIRLVGWKGEAGSAPWHLLLKRLESLLQRNDLLAKEKERAAALAQSPNVALARGYEGAELKALYGRLDNAEEAEILGRYDFHDLNSMGPFPPVTDENGAYWLDYVGNIAGTLPGAYSVPYLLAMDQLNVHQAGVLKAGDILVLGGGQVDPNQTNMKWMLEVMCRWPLFRDIRRFIIRRKLPTLYKEQLLKLLRAAYDSRVPTRKLFAIPGWGDRSDGLAAFDNTFCTPPGRDANTIGGWQCIQHRSYWHLRLPYDWWVWGIDLAFDEPFDREQIAYFNTISEQMSPRDNLILMIAEPLWLKAHEQGRDEEENFFKVVSIARARGVRICSVLASSTVHYNRYYAHELDVHFLVAGAGGGAFLEPTHILKNAITVRWPERPDEIDEDIRSAPTWKSRDYDIRLKRNYRTAESVVEQAVQDVQDVLEPLQKRPLGRRRQPLKPQSPKCYPVKSASYLLLVKSLLFPFRNIGFCSILGAYYLVAGLLTRLAFDDLPVGGLEALSQLPSPNLKMMPLAIWLAVGTLLLICYAEMPAYLSRWSRWIGKIFVGTLHAAAHFAGVATLLNAIPTSFEHQLLTAQLVSWGGFFVAAIVFSGLIVALYWILNAQLLRTHTKEPFSALEVTRFRNFIRFKFERDRLTIYPLGINRPLEPHEWRKTTAKGVHGLASNPSHIAARPIDVFLIENPIVIESYDYVE